MSRERRSRRSRVLGLALAAVLGSAGLAAAAPAQAATAQAATAPSATALSAAAQAHRADGHSAHAHRARAHRTHATTQGATVYVDCSQPTDGNGTRSSPYDSLSDVDSTVFTAGETLAFNSGTTCTGTLSPLGSGTVSAPVTITDYGTGALPVIDGAGAASAVTLTNQDNWTVENLDLTDQATTEAQRTGLLVQSTDGTAHTGYTVQDLVVDGVAGVTDKATEATAFADSAGIEFGTANTGSTLNNVLVTDDQVSNAGGGGIKVRVGAMTAQGTNVLVENNTVSDDGGDGIIVEYADAPMIQDNTAQGLGTGTYPWTGGNFAAIWVLGDDNPTIQNNVVTGTVMSAFDSEAFDCDWGNTGTCTVQYNLTYDNAGGFFLNCDGCGTSGAPTQVVRDNIFQDDCRSISNGNAVHLYFYNNDVYCPNTPLSVEWPSNSTIENNVFVGESTSSLPTGSGIGYWWNVFQGVPRPTANGIVGDPGFVDPGTVALTPAAATGFELCASSPALDNGAPMSDNGGQDFFGNPLSPTAKPDRGAYNGPAITGC